MSNSDFWHPNQVFFYRKLIDSIGKPAISFKDLEVNFKVFPQLEELFIHPNIAQFISNRLHDRGIEITLSIDDGTSVCDYIKKCRQDKIDAEDLIEAGNADLFGIKLFTNDLQEAAIISDPAITKKIIEAFYFLSKEEQSRLFLSFSKGENYNVMIDNFTAYLERYKASELHNTTGVTPHTYKRSKEYLKTLITHEVSESGNRKAVHLHLQSSPFVQIDDSVQYDRFVRFKLLETLLSLESDGLIQITDISNRRIVFDTSNMYHHKYLEIDVGFVDSKVRIKHTNIVIARPNYESENDAVIQYLFKNPNISHTRKLLEKRLKRSIEKPFSKVIDNLGFSGDLKKIFFNYSDRTNRIRLNNPVSVESIEGMGIDVDEVLLLKYH